MLGVVSLRCHSARRQAEFGSEGLKGFAPVQYVVSLVFAVLLHFDLVG